MMECTMNNSALASITRIINPCNINLFKDSYIECLKELLELENADITKNIRFYITEDGKHYCQLWGWNCSYSVDDLRKNKEYKVEIECFDEIIEEWKNDYINSRLNNL